MKTSLWPWQAQMLPRFSICILAREEYPWALTVTWWSGIQMLSRSSLPRTTSRYGLSGWAWSRLGNMGGEQGQERCEFVVSQGNGARMCCNNQSSWIPRDIKPQQFISHFCFAKWVGREEGLCPLQSLRAGACIDTLSTCSIWLLSPGAGTWPWKLSQDVTSSPPALAKARTVGTPHSRRASSATIPGAQKEKAQEKISQQLW